MKVRVGTTWTTPEAILAGAHPEPPGPSTERALNWCRQWWQGNTQFSFHTSGSTGAPKTIQFHRSQIEASARLTASALSLTAGEVAVVCLDTAYVAGAMMVFRSLVCDMDLVILEPSAKPLKAYDGPCDFISLVPYQLSALLDEDPSRLNTIRAMLIGGAPAPASLLSRLTETKSAIYATYGMTETLTHVALQRISGAHPEPAFKALNGITFTSNDSGCLVIHAPHFADPVVTQDVVELLDSTHFKWMGRADRVVNSGGVKILLEPLEVLIQPIMCTAAPDRRFFVDKVPDEKFGEAVALVIEGSPMNTDELRKLLVSRLDRFQVPRYFLFAAKFTETATQKTDRRATLQSILTVKK